MPLEKRGRCCYVTPALALSSPSLASRIHNSAPLAHSLFLPPCMELCSHTTESLPCWSLWLCLWLLPPLCLQLLPARSGPGSGRFSHHHQLCGQQLQTQQGQISAGGLSLQPVPCCARRRCNGVAAAPAGLSAGLRVLSVGGRRASRARMWADSWPPPLTGSRSARSTRGLGSNFEHEMWDIPWCPATIRATRRAPSQRGSALRVRAAGRHRPVSRPSPTPLAMIRA